MDQDFVGGNCGLEPPGECWKKVTTMSLRVIVTYTERDGYWSISCYQHFLRTLPEFFADIPSKFQWPETSGKELQWLADESVYDYCALRVPHASRCLSLSFFQVVAHYCNLFKELREKGRKRKKEKINLVGW